MHFRKDNAELATPVAEVGFSLGWQQLQRQHPDEGGHVDVLEQEPLFAEGFEVECATAELEIAAAPWQPVALSIPVNSLDNGTKKGLINIENSLQCLLGSAWKAVPQLDATQPCVAEVSLPSYCVKTGTWRRSA